MYTLLLLGIVSFLSALVLTPLIRNAFVRLGFVDRPDAGRKVHPSPIPRVGGVAIAIAYTLAFAVLLVSPLKGGWIVYGSLGFIVKVLPSAALIFALGLLDDLFGLKPWEKLFGQFVAAIIAVAAGIRITGVLDIPLGPWVCAAITVIWLVGCTNAFNLIDGMDGLATGVGLFATLTITVAALLSKNVDLAMATVPLAGALLGFLRFNFNPASIFLGDCGSLLIGFLLGAFGIVWSQKSATMLAMTAPLMALSIPLLDTALAIARRFLRQQPIFGGDRGHIHHRLLARGMSVRKVVLLMYGVCGIAACLSLLLSVANQQFNGVIVVLFCACTWLGIQHLGYVEFGVARRMMLAGAFRRQLGAQLALTSFVDALEKAHTPEDCWHVIRGSYRDFGFSEARLRLGGRDFHEALKPGTDSWHIRIPLSETDTLTLARDFQQNGHMALPEPFADRVRTALLPKLTGFEMDELAGHPVLVANTTVLHTRVRAAAASMQQSSEV